MTNTGQFQRRILMRPPKAALDAKPVEPEGCHWGLIAPLWRASFAMSFTLAILTAPSAHSGELIYFRAVFYRDLI